MIWLFFMFIGLIGVDQLTKSLAVNHLMGNESVVVIDKILSLTYVENRGAAYGLLSNNRFILLLLTVVLMIGIVYVLFNFEKYFKNKNLKVLLVLILAGAFGNMIDRVFLGYVVDFLQFTFIDFPVFNFADICVVLGSVGLIIFSLREEM